MGDMELTAGELHRTVVAIERRMMEMHAENREALSEIREEQRRTNELFREQNGRVSRLEIRTAVGETKQQTTERKLEAIQAAVTQAATQAATGAASQAIHETAPTQKRAAAITAAAAGAVGGGFIGLAKAIEILMHVFK